MEKRQLLVVGLLGVVCGLLMVLVVQSALVPVAVGQGASTSGASSEWLMGVTTTSGGKAACFLFNTKDVKLGLYTSTGTTFNLSGIRLCTHDFQLVQYGRGMRPTVDDIKKLLRGKKR